MPATDLEIIVGTYEEFLLGYRVSKKEDDKVPMNFILVFLKIIGYN